MCFLHFILSFSELQYLPRFVSYSMCSFHTISRNFIIFSGVITLSWAMPARSCDRIDVQNMSEIMRFSGHFDVIFVLPGQNCIKLMTGVCKIMSHFVFVFVLVLCLFCACFVFILCLFCSYFVLILFCAYFVFFMTFLCQISLEDIVLTPNSNGNRMIYQSLPRAKSVPVKIEFKGLFDQDMRFRDVKLLLVCFNIIL